jgi:ABC-type transport system involved in multi-copper enzyme maturation permease subunit
MSIVQAILRREAVTTLHNRYVQIFALLLAAGSLTVVGAAGSAASVSFGALLLLLYVIPLFAVLIGVSAAQEEREEQPLLLSHPLPRGWFVGGKLAVLAGALALVLTLALIPVGIRVGSAASTGVLWGLGLALVLVWGSTGLAVGFAAKNRARGLVLGLTIWFASLVLYDLCTFLLAGVDAMQARPTLWVSLLLLNPADAVRLAGLTALDGLSFTAPGTTEAVATLLAWTPLWTVGLTVLWTVGATLLARRALETRH